MRTYVWVQPEAHEGPSVNCASTCPPNESAISQARRRLGAGPLAALFERVAQPIGIDDMAAGWLAGRRLVAIDGTCLDAADISANAEHFKRPGANKAEQAAFPQAPYALWRKATQHHHHRRSPLTERR